MEIIQAGNFHGPFPVPTGNTARPAPSILQTDNRLRFAEFAPSRPQRGLTERHENHSRTARQSRDLFLIFGAADVVGRYGRGSALLLRQHSLPRRQPHFQCGERLPRSTAGYASSRAAAPLSTALRATSGRSSSPLHAAFRAQRGLVAQSSLRALLRRLKEPTITIVREFS